MSEYQCFEYAGAAIGVNRMFEGGKSGKRWPNPKYRKFLEDLQMTFQAQRRKETIPEGSAVEVNVFVRCPTTADAHNYNKPILDVLEKAGVYENDRQVIRMRTVASSQHTRPGLAVFIVTVRTCERASGLVEARLSRLEV